MKQKRSVSINQPYLVDVFDDRPIRIQRLHFIAVRGMNKSQSFEEFSFFNVGMNIHVCALHQEFVLYLLYIPLFQ